MIKATSFFHVSINILELFVLSGCEMGGEFNHLRDELSAPGSIVLEFKYPNNFQLEKKRQIYKSTWTYSAKDESISITASIDEDLFTPSVTPQDYCLKYKDNRQEIFGSIFPCGTSLFSQREVIVNKNIPAICTEMYCLLSDDDLYYELAFLYKGKVLTIAICFYNITKSRITKNQADNIVNSIFQTLKIR
ncbi:MAG: hypothetical protein JNN28_05705 [Saprospiraceae bacterium]|nr:hypothetical protein [Saprospiraceae bacterium]